MVDGADMRWSERGREEVFSVQFSVGELRAFIYDLQSAIYDPQSPIFQPRRTRIHAKGGVPGAGVGFAARRVGVSVLALPLGGPKASGLRRLRSIALGDYSFMDITLANRRH